MKKQLKFTCLLLLVTSITFAQIQNSAVVRSKSNISNNLTTHSGSDSTIKIANSTITKSRSNIKTNKTIPVDSSKTPVTTTNQPSRPLKKGIVSLIKKNSGGGDANSPAATDSLRTHTGVVSLPKKKE